MIKDSCLYFSQSFSEILNTVRKENKNSFHEPNYVFKRNREVLLKLWMNSKLKIIWKRKQIEKKFNMGKKFQFLLCLILCNFKV